MKGIIPAQLHHTYIISGDRPILVKEICLMLRKEFDVSEEDVRDFVVKEYETLYVDDAREILTLQRQKNLASMQFFVLSAREIVTEAQHAFLKMTEEPSPNTYFFFIVPDHDSLLATLKSRAVLIEHRGDTNEYRDVAKEFILGTPVERFKIVEPFHPKEGDLPDKEAISQFLSALEVELFKVGIIDGLHDVYDIKMKIKATGVSVKMLLDHLAIVVPFHK